MNQRLLDALHQSNTGCPPVWFMRQAGRYLPEYQKIRSNHSFLEMCHTPKLIAEVTQLPIKRFDFDAAILFSDILTITEPLGLGLSFEEKRGPVIHRPLTPETLTLPEVNITTSLNYVAEGIDLLLPQLDVPLLGFAGAPFTVASYLIEGESKTQLHKTKKWLFQHPESFHTLLQILTDMTIEYLQMQIQAGVHAIQLFDSWANVLAPPQLQEFSLQYQQQIIDSLDKPTILFSRGSSLFARDLAGLEPNGISIDWNGDLAAIRQEVGPNITLQGNLDPHVLFSSKETLEREVLRILEKMEGDPAFIFNLGHGILPETPLKNVELVLETIKNRSPIACR